MLNKPSLQTAYTEALERCKLARAMGDRRRHASGAIVIAMTIAAGILCGDGVLLCADTEHTGYTSKSHYSKVDRFEVSGGKVSFAVAGVADLAWSAMQKCQRRLEADPSGDLVDTIEEILDSEYRRNVASHPDYGNRDYSLLLSLWTPSKGAALYSANGTALTKIRDFKCLGIGAELASYLIRPGMAYLHSLKDAAVLAAYTMGCVKEAITGCGGMSIYLLTRKDGSTALLTSDHDGPTKDVENFARFYDFLTRRLLLRMADMQAEDIHFEHNLQELFIKEISNERRRWISAYLAKEQQFANVNPHLTPAQAKVMFAELSIGFVPKPPSVNPPALQEPKPRKPRRKSSAK